jgi:hypothetical protein
LAITNRELPVGTKLVAKYKDDVYHAEVVPSDDPGGVAYRLLLNGETVDYKSPSGAGGAIFGVDKDGKPRTCNGWSFWSVEGVEPAAGGDAPDATSAPKPRTRKRHAKPMGDEATTDPDAALPIIGRLDDQVECGECGLVFMERSAAAAHIREAHPTYADREMVTA